MVMVIFKSRLFVLLFEANIKSAYLFNILFWHFLPFTVRKHVDFIW